jgi:hypothetical protein
MGPAIEGMHAVVAIAGAVTLAIVLAVAVRAARRGQVVGNGMLACSLVLFIGGAGAFAATRKQAADGAHPVDPLNGGEEITVPHPTELARCGPAAQAYVPAPILTAGKQLELNGAPIASFAQFHDDMITIWNNYRLLHPDRIGRDHLRVMLIPEPDAPTGPALQGLSSVWPNLPAGFFALIGGLRPAPIDTQTRGRIDRKGICAYPLVIDPKGRHFATFGELLTALSQSNEPFAVAP